VNNTASSARNTLDKSCKDIGAKLSSSLYGVNEGDEFDDYNEGVLFGISIEANDQTVSGITLLYRGPTSNVLSGLDEGELFSLRDQYLSDEFIGSRNLMYHGSRNNIISYGGRYDVRDYILLRKSEYVTEAEVSCDDHYVTSLLFRTNQNRTLGTCGNTGNNPFTVTAPKGYMIVGIKGRTTDFFEKDDVGFFSSIGFHFRPIDHNSPPTANTTQIISSLLWKGLQYYGYTPIHHAVQFNFSSEDIKILIGEYPEALKIQDSFGNTPLHTSLHYYPCTVDNVATLFKKYPKAAKMPDCRGDTPIHSAAYRCTPIHIIKMFVDRYPEGLEIQNRLGYTPLHGMDLKRLDTMVKAYPWLVAKNKYGALPYERCGQHAPLHEVVKMNLSTLVVKLIIQAFPESCLLRDESGMTALHHACASNAAIWFENVIILLEANASILNLEDNEGKTPFQMLSRRFSVPDENGMLPLHQVASQSMVLTEKSLRMFVKAFPDSIEKQDKNGMLPFHHACFNPGINTEVLMVFIIFFPEAIKPITPERKSTIEGRV